MNELNYTLMYQIREEIKEEYEKYKCDPRKYNIGYCKDVKGENCPNTCEYAVGKGTTQESRMFSSQEAPNKRGFFNMRR